MVFSESKTFHLRAKPIQIQDGQREGKQSILRQLVYRELKKKNKPGHPNGEFIRARVVTGVRVKQGAPRGREPSHPGEELVKLRFRKSLYCPHLLSPPFPNMHKQKGVLRDALRPAELPGKSCNTTFICATCSGVQLL